MESAKHSSFSFLLSITFGISLLFLIFFLYQAWANPLIDWDILGYFGSVALSQGNSPEHIHSIAYEAVRQNVPPEKFQAFLIGDYRLQLSQNATAFVAQLPFYTIRVLYTCSLSLLNAFGFSLFQSARVIQIFAGLLIFMISSFWCRRIFQGWSWPLMGIFLLVASGFPLTIRGITPDAFAASFSLAALYFTRTLKHFWWGFLFSALAVAARPDAIFLSMMTCALPLFVHWNRLPASQRLGVAVTEGLLFALFWGIQTGFGAYPYTTLFHHTFVQYLVRPDEGAYPLLFSQYLMAVKQGVSQVLLSQTDCSGVLAGIFLLLAFLRTALLRGFRFLSPPLIAGSALALVMACRFFLFPTGLERLWFAHCLAIFFFLLEYVKETEEEMEAVLPARKIP